MKQPSRLPQWPRRWPGARRWLRWTLIARLLLLLGATGVLTLLVFIHLDYYQVGASLAQFRVNTAAPRDILAPRLLDWEDTVETKRRQDVAAEGVPVQYVKDASASDTARADLDTLIRLLSKTDLTSTDHTQLEDKHIPATLVEHSRDLSPEAWDTLHRHARSILGEVMADTIREGEDEQRAYKQIDAQAASLEAEKTRVELVSAVTRAAVRPTLRRDDEATERRRQEERARVQPVLRKMQRGDLVIRQGQMLTAEDLRQLKELRLLTPAPLARLLPVGVIILFGLLLLGLYLRTYCRTVYNNPRKLLLLVLLLVTPLWANMTFSRGEDQGMIYLVGLLAIPAGAMAVSGLLGTPVAIVSAVLMAMVSGLTADEPFTMTLLLLGSALTGVIAVSAIWPASRAIPGVLMLMAVNFGLIACLEGMRPGVGLPYLLSHLGGMTLTATAGGIGAVFVAVGAIYMLARPFGITTHYRLMELSNSNEPLLRRLLLEAPGSYHSSVMVSNMAESAADAIGANPLFTRVAALYHDIGKLKRPAFFVENQAPLGLDNVHQRLSPRLSYLILISHVRDGVELGREHGLPEEVIDIISEHHGTTLAAYFFYRARNDANGETVSEQEFRYPGPKPSTRESAVVMLADSVQAAVKALKEPSPSRIEHMVSEIIDSRLADAQLEDCDITLQDLKRIREVFVRMLTGLYSYSRVEYPDTKGRTNTRAHSDLENASPAHERSTAASGR